MSFEGEIYTLLVRVICLIDCRINRRYDMDVIQGKSIMGRPSSYTQELANEICETIQCTSKGIKRLCKEHEHWPSHNTIYRWLSTYSEFNDRYARAKRQQIEVLVDEILSIAEDSSNDYMMNEDGKLVVNHEHIQRSRLRIDTIKWLAAKLCPRIYGDRIQVDNTNDEAAKEIARVKLLVEELKAKQE
ncbi:MAG TPA: hypothetical protein VFU62_14105 [Hanamia sp.]|nr:hypothetical protein [Hanamia sp.]